MKIILITTGFVSADSAVDQIVYNLDLTSDEIQWIDDHQIIRVSGPLKFPPFHFFNEDGVPLGIALIMSVFFFQNLDIQLDIQSDLSWSEILNNTKNKELDLISCSAKSSGIKLRFIWNNIQIFSLPMDCAPVVMKKYMEIKHGSKKRKMKNKLTVEFNRCFMNSSTIRCKKLI